MPNLQNAHKALRQSKVRAERNKKRTNEIDTLTRQFRKALEANKVDDAKALISTIYKKLDKAVSKNVVKKNTAARVKSRMTTNLNKATKK
ncbi:MAG: 30S ribosomal protein S20 [Patescibacteria group bacterium]